MRFSSAAIALGAASVNAASLQGFNYGAGLTTGAAKTQDDFETDFKKAQNLKGTSGWNAARLYTNIQVGSTNDPIAAIPAAIATNTKLLLGVWASAGQEAVTNEIAALEKAVAAHGKSFTDLVVGLSVGSEDLYRITPTGIKNKAGVGAGPDVLVSYIKQIKAKNWGFSIGHVDTWTAWTNSSNQAVIDAVDWLGFDGYPYFESELDNTIENAEQLFDQSFEATKGVAGGKDVWMTESGWPVSGDLSGKAVASTENAEKYWQSVACKLIGNTNTFWYTLRDAEPTTPSPSFGIIGSDINSDPLYDLTCSKQNSTSSSSSSASSSAAKASGTATASESSSTGSGSSDQGQGSPAVGAFATGSASSGSSTSGNATSSSYSAGSPSSTTSSGDAAQYSTGAASTTTFSTVAAIVAVFGLVARM